MPTPNDYAAIAAAAQAQIDTLHAIDGKLHTAIQSLHHKMAQGTITQQELIEFGRLKTALRAVNDDRIAISEAALVALDNTAQVSATIEALKRVTKSIESQKDALTKLAKAIQEVASVMAGIDGLITKLMSFIAIV